MTLDLVVAFVVTGGGGWLLARLVPEAPGTFDGFMRGRLLRMAGRLALVLAIVILGVGVLRRPPATITIGALAGWLAGSLGELRLARRPGPGDGD